MHVMQKTSPPRTLRAYVDSLQQSGRYSFSRDDALAAVRLSTVALKRAAQRLSQQGRIVSPRRGFFVIVPLEYKTSGAPPASWFIDHLMRHQGQVYYVGLLSAAALHGAAHQQPQRFQVMVGRQLRPARAGRNQIHFVMKKGIEKTPITALKTETGSMCVSSPEATAIDLVRYPDQAGGLSNVASVLSELAESMDAKRLRSAARRESDLAAAQRLGYLLDHLGASGKAEELARWVRMMNPRAVALRPGRAGASASSSTRWKVSVNERIEAPE